MSEPTGPAPVRVKTQDMADSCHRVLLVAADDADRRSVSDFLAAIPHQTFRVERVASRENALEKMRHEPYEVCLVEFSRYGRSAREFLRDAHVLAPDIPVILLSRAGDLQSENAAIEAGAADELVKPRLTEKALSRSIRNAIAYAKKLRDSNRSHALLQTLIDHSPALTYVKDLDLRHLLVNRKLLDAFDVGSDQMIGETGADCLPEDFSKHSREWDRKVIESKTVIENEFALTTPRGTRWVNSIKFPVLDPSGRVDAVGGITLDITERKRSEEALRTSEELFRTIYQTVDIGIAMTDLDGRILQSNPAYRRMLGYTGEELGRITLLDCTHPEDRADHAHHLRALAERTCESADFVVRHIRKDGSICWAKIKSSGLNGAGGERARVITVTEDITEAKQAAEALQGRNEVLELLATGASLDDVLTALAETAERVRPQMLCSVFLLDEEHNRLVRGVAPSLPDDYKKTIDGLEIGPHVGSGGAAAYTRKRVIIRDIMSHPNWTDFRGPAAAAGLRACWSEPIIASNDALLGILALYYRQPRVPDQTDLDFIKTTAHLAGIAIERKRAESTLKAAKEDAERASQAKSEFLANMSHELRTPLNAIIGFSEIIKEQMLGPIDRAEYVDYGDDIFQSGHLLLQLINDVLDVSKLAAGKFELHETEVDFESTLSAAMHLVAGRAETAGVSMGVKIAPDLPWIRGDERRLTQILLNLLTNAVKFTPSGGRVSIEAATDPEGNVSITVADTGIGMAPHEIPRALELFGQVDTKLSRRYEGSGLGLPLCKAIVELHDGRLEFESALGEGTTVIITFPAERTVRAAEPKTATGREKRKATRPPRSAA